MNETIVDLQKEREKRSPHLSGWAHCIACGEEWVAVSPAGTVWLTCPKCKSEKGLYSYSCVREGTSHWICNCGNDLFHITPEGMYCPNCGEWQEGF